LQELSSAFEAVHARNAILEKENRDFRDAQTGGKRKKAGVTVSNLETHVFSTEDVQAKVRAAEDARRPRGQRGPGEDLVRDALMALEPIPSRTALEFMHIGPSTWIFKIEREDASIKGVCIK